jgi:hypothetical protein
LNHILRRVSLLSFCAVSLHIQGAAITYSQKFRDQDPYFYAVVAKAAYKHSRKSVQKVLDKKLGTGRAEVLQTVTYRQSLYGNTNMILVKDDRNRLHVGFEGSTDLGNWARNLKSLYKNVEKDVLRGMHNVITDWEKWQPGCTLVSIVGHSQGGMYASQLVRLYKRHYTEPAKTKSGKIDRSKRSGRATVITFNAYKPKKAPYQFHFATEDEHAVTLCSSKGRYIPIPCGNNDASIASNHSMKYVVRGLRGKKWEDFKKHNPHIL